MWKKRSGKPNGNESKAITTRPKVHAPVKEPNEVATAEDLVQRLEAFELERFCRLEAEMRLCVQGIQLIEFETLEVKRALQVKLAELEKRKAVVKTELNGKWRVAYESLLGNLANKYGISEPARMLVDTDAGTIRDSQEA